LLKLAGELVIVVSEFVDPGSEVFGADRVELLSELVPYGVMELFFLLPELPDLLAGQVQFCAKG